MIDMDALEYLKVKKRICTLCGGCSKCPVGIQNNKYREPCSDFERNHPEEAVSIVEKWSVDHPVKTRQSEFLKIIPDATIRNGVLKLKPCEVNEKIKARCIEYDYCRDCRKDYWLAEV